MPLYNVCVCMIRVWYVLHVDFHNSISTVEERVCVCVCVMEAFQKNGMSFILILLI